MAGQAVGDVAEGRDIRRQEEQQRQPSSSSGLHQVGQRRDEAVGRRFRSVAGEVIRRQSGRPVGPEQEALGVSHRARVVPEEPHPLGEARRRALVVDEALPDAVLAKRCQHRVRFGL